MKEQVRVVVGVLLVLGHGFAQQEIQAARGRAVTLDELEEYRAKGVPDEELPRLLEAIGSRDQASAVRSLFKERFPATNLVEMLTHPRLAVRLGALDLLEEAADDTFGFDPWAVEPAVGTNAAALERWQAWAKHGDPKVGRRPARLDEATFRVLAMEIMSGDRERSERAMHRLEQYGLAAISYIEEFFKRQPTLDAGPKTALKIAEYRLVLGQVMPRQAAVLARELAAGSPETQSTALNALGEAGPTALPIINELLSSPDALVRETAVDAAFEAAQKAAAPLILQRLATEQSESVLHAMLRGLGEHTNEEEEAKAIARFLDHPSENVVITALETLGQNTAGDLTKAFAARLEDSRWRVRAAALEAIEKRDLGALRSQVEKSLDDSDEFVRVSAVNAYLEIGGSVRALTERFVNRDDLKAPILRALYAKDREPPSSLWKALWNSPPEVILPCLALLEDRNDYQGKRIPRAAPFAAHPNRDVSATALRLLASRGRHTSLLLEALKSDDSLKQDAVLDELRLPPGFLQWSHQGESRSGASRRKPGPLEKIVGFFTGGFDSEEEIPPPDRAERHAAPAEMQMVLERFFQKGSPHQRFRAAVVLMAQGHEPAAQSLLESLETLSSLDRRQIASALESVRQWEGSIEKLAVQLLRDPAGDVREQALEAWLDDGRSDQFALLLQEFSRPGSLLTPDDLYGYRLDRLASRPQLRQTIFDWGTTLLDSADAPAARKVLAIILLGRSGQAEVAKVARYLDSANPWLRRATYRVLGLGMAEQRLKLLLNDDSAMVRAVLPFLAAPQNSAWLHWFDDATRIADSEDVEDVRHRSRGAARSQQREKPSAETVAALEKLAADPSDYIRFEAQFALLRLDRPIDAKSLAALVAAQPAETRARHRIGNFLENNYRRLDRSYGKLLALAKDIDNEEFAKIAEHFGSDPAPASFAALAALAPAPPAEVVRAPAAAPEPATTADFFRVVFFHKPGCRDCDRVRSMLEEHAAKIPGMRIQERDINERRAALLNEALAERFELKETLHQVAPAVFTQAGALVRDEITFPRLGTLLRKASAMPPETAWAEVAEPEIAAAETTIQQRYAALSFGVVAAAGLLDGVNPCAFATIILLLSYLQVARRTPREILAVGVAFVGAVFLTYFIVGLGLAQVLTKIAALRVAGTLLTYLLAMFAVVIALLSFRDAQLAAQGQAGEMTLQLPAILKDRIRSTIRTGTRARRFVMAAFGAGVVISLLELACTGQVYLPTILYMLRSGNAGAIGHLLLYNAAFVAPLVVVFALAWAGMRSDALIRFQQRHTMLVKILTGLLFLLLAVFLLFGYEMLPQAASRE